MRARLYLPAAASPPADWRALGREALQSAAGLALMAAGFAAIASFGLALVGLGFAP